MKTLKIYNIIATIMIAALVIWVVSLLKDLKETEELLDQCSQRYYQKIN